MVSYVVQNDVARARAHMDFSKWDEVERKLPEDRAASYSGICENLLSGAMPKKPYLLAHSKARLNQSEVEQVCNWANRESMQALTRK